MRTKRTTPSLFRPSDFVPYPKSGIDQDIPARFRAQARLYPTRTAVSDGKDSMTYSELEISSNQIANSILAARGDREEPIAFLFETGRMHPRNTEGGQDLRRARSLDNT